MRAPTEALSEQAAAVSRVSDRGDGLRDIADHAHSIVWMADADGICCYLSPGASAHLAALADMDMEEWAAFIHPDDRERLRPVFRQAKEARSEYQVEYRLVRSDGSVRWVFSAGAPRFAEDGSFLGYVGMLVDCSVRHEALARLAKSEETHRLLTESSSDLISHHAPGTGVYLYVSPSSRRILGFEPSELLGRSVYDLVHPDDVALLRAEVLRQQERGADDSRLVEFRLRHKDGRYIWLGAMASLLLDPATGEKLGAVAVSRDITAERRAREELRQSEARFRSLTDLSSDWYWETDAEGCFTFISDGVHRLFGTSPNEVIGLTRVERAADPDQPGLLEYVDKTSRHLPFRDLVYSSFVFSKGTVRHSALSGEPVFEDGRFVGYRGVARDITEQIRLNAEMARLSDENRALIENSLDVIAMLDPEGRFVRINGTVEEVLGYPPAEMLGRSYLDFLLPADRGMLEGVAFGIDGNARVIRNMVCRWRRKDGRIVHLSLSGRPLQERNALHVTARDVTESLKARDRIASVLESIGDAFFALDRDWRATYVNQKTADFLGHRQEDLVGRILWEAVPEILDSQAMRYFRLAMETGRRLSFELYWEPVRAWCEVRVYPSEEGISVFFHDISTRRAAEQAVRASEERLRRMVELTPAGYLLTDAKGAMIEVNPALCELTGYLRDELVGRDISQVLPVCPLDNALLVRHGASAVQGKETTLRHKQGHDVYVLASINIERDANGHGQSLTAFVTDITERKQAEGRLRELATHDTLTGLPNRTLLGERLQKMLDGAGSRTPVAVLFVDLDHFKEVNDSMGHGQGDVLLNEVAQRLRTRLRPDDIVARLGGDEFVVAAPCSEGTFSARCIVEKLFAALAEPMQIGDQEVFVRASVGISMYPHDGTGKDALLQNADTAMYCAKAAGRNCYRFFEATMSAEAKNRLSIEHALHRALERKEFELFYQPRLGLGSLEVMGMEALIRWNHPQLGRLAPLEFIPIAEERGFIAAIGNWVLEEACAQARRLTDRFGKPLRVAVNLSARQLKDGRLVEQVRDALQRNGLPASQLELELTESALVDDMQRSVEMFERLKALGVSLAVDDFGTGYSGLAYLGQFPLDVLKLDKSLVNQQRDERISKVIRAFIDMAHTLGLSVVAEGVETADTQHFLEQAGCDEAQGYLFAKPLAIDDFEAFLAQSAPAIMPAG
jgi:diguanylate cyclase (GGDEF)-like protein/PAS domain S-box-containing protein